MAKVFGWMTVGLALTAAISAYFAASGRAENLVNDQPLLFFGLIILELVLVFGLSFAIKKISALTASIVFLLYAALNGVTLSVIFLAYTATSITSVFVAAAAMFGVMALYGYTTKRDLTKLGSLLLMALFGLIIAMIVNVFIHSPGFNLAVSAIGVLIFVGLTAYDAQKIKQLAAQGMTGETASKAAIIGALSLYLDLINLFLFLLRIFGQRR
jgi:FtsH-binding integral membrane protein